MKRPNLINPQNDWNPFKSIPTPTPTPTPTPMYQPPMYQPPITRREYIQRNSFWLNVIGLAIILGMSYFLYSVYIERKILSEMFEHYQQQNYHER